MKTRVTILKTDFYKDPNNKVITCKLSCLFNLGELSDYVDYSMWKKKFPKIDRLGYFTVTASTRCNKNDTYDEVKGTRIAESKAKAKMYWIATRFFGVIYDKLSIITSKFRDLERHNCKIFDNEVEHIDCLIDGN